ncbi:MAG: D-glycerate dehydrogenase [Gammaproteobacteria bacterium]|nr:D-glycerate dehydrogenase [Gammaproteobacteria bacterium]
MTKSRVLLDVPFPAFLSALFEPHVALLPWTELSESQGELHDIDAILSFAHTPIGEPELTRLPRVKVVSNYGVGVDHIDVAAAARHAVPVGNTPGAVDGATADQAMALMLAVARNTVRGDAFARGPDFHAFDPAFMLGTDVFGATLGIVGMGRIGIEVARRARGFGMQILYYNRRRDETAEQELGARYKDLDALLAESDFVSLNMPLTEQTTGMIDAAALARMKPTAFLINTARGGVVDTDALYAALRDGRIAGAGLDVTEPEPLPRNHPLLGLQNLVITPHLGTSTLGTRKRMGQMALDNLLAGLAGRPLPYVVTA